MNEQIDSSIPVLTEIIHSPTSATPEAPQQRSANNAGPIASPTTTAPSALRSSTSALATSTVAANTTNMGLNFAPQALIRESNAESIPTNAASFSSTLPEIDSDDWILLEQSVRENVLKQVLSRVDFVLEHRVSDSLADVLQKAVDQLADDIRVGLKKSIEEVVTRAVNQEITKLKGMR